MAHYMAGEMYTQMYKPKATHQEPPPPAVHHTFETNLDYGALQPQPAQSYPYNLQPAQDGAYDAYSGGYPAPQQQQQQQQPQYAQLPQPQHHTQQQYPTQPQYSIQSQYAGQSLYPMQQQQQQPYPAQSQGYPAQQQQQPLLPQQPAQQFVPPQEQLRTGSTSNSDIVCGCAVQLTTSNSRMKLMDHPSVPRLRPQDLNEDLARVYPSPSYMITCRPASVRPTFSTFPSTPQLGDSLQLPIGINVRPFAEPRVAEVDPAEFGNRMVRCRKCQCYINPFTTFTDGGRRWQCTMCRNMNDTGTEYYSPVDPNTGLRQDIMRRPELVNCTVDFYPTAEFLRRPPKRPIMLLMLDCSFPAVTSGLLENMCKGALDALESMRDDDVLHMGVVGFDATVYFFNLRSSLSAPRMICAADTVDDVCNVNDNFKLDPVELPCPITELVVPVKDSYHLLKDLFEKLPGLFAKTKEVDCAYGPALAASITMLENNGGKIISSVCCIPSVGEGKLKQRFDPSKLSNQPKEYTMCATANDWYKQRALVCSNSGTSVDIFAGGTTDLDLTTIAPLSRFTSGNIHRATPQSMGGIAAQVKHALVRFTAFDSILRVRTSNGVIVPNFYGHCHVREPDLLALPVADEDSSYSVELKVGPGFKGSFAYVQFAVVYTTRARERRIRVHTIQIPVSPSIGRIVNSANSIGVACFLTKMCVDYAVSCPYTQAKQKVTDKLVSFIRLANKNMGGQGQPPGQLMLPESIKFVPQILNGFFRCPAIGLATVRTIPPDERVAFMAQVMASPPEAMLSYYLGWSYLLFLPTTPLVQLPSPMYSSQQHFTLEGIFLVNVGSAVVLWYGKKVDPGIVAALGLTQGEPGFSDSTCEALRDVPLDELQALTQRIRALIEEQQAISKPAFCATVGLCAQGNTVFEPMLTRCMTEDTVKEIPSYSDYLKILWTKVNGDK